MFQSKLTNAEIEARRLDLLESLERFSPMTIFADLEQSSHAAFIISDAAARSIRRALALPQYRNNESTALAKVKIAAKTPDDSGYVYLIEAFHFENLGNADGVYSAERDILHEGEIEVHSHVFSRPEYLGKTDIGDLIACVEGPAWHSPRPQIFDTALRIFGILSVYPNRMAQLQFYRHDLRSDLSEANNFGLSRAGMPISFPNAY